MPGAGKQILAAAVLTVVVVVAGLVALVAGTLFGGDSDTTAPVAASTPVPRATVTVTATPSLSLPPAPTASSSPSGTPSETPSGSSEPDATAYDELGPTPWTDPGMDFGFITRARSRDGELQLTVNRARFLGGDEAVEANGGVAPENDYLIVDSSARTRVFTVDEDAVLIGTDVLDDDEDPTSPNRLSRTELRTRVTDAVASGRPPMVWLRHADASSPDTSPVTFLQEQYVP